MPVFINSSWVGHREMRYFRFPVLLMTSFLVASCLPVGDAAVKVRGQFIDETNKRYDDCLGEIRYEGKLLETVKISGAFDKTIIFHPTSSDPIHLSVSCVGTNTTYKRVITEIPADFGEYVDLGNIVLKRN